MLNYIWAGLVSFALIFAIVADVEDLRSQTYRNERLLPRRLNFAIPLTLRRETIVDVRIDPAVFASHFNTSEVVAATYPATLTKGDGGYLLKFAKDASLPPRLATMRDYSDTKELIASISALGSVQGKGLGESPPFPPVRFVKIRSITTAAIDMVQTAVELSLKLIGVLALWLGLMKIAVLPGADRHHGEDHPAAAASAVSIHSKRASRNGIHRGESRGKYPGPGQCDNGDGTQGDGGTTDAQSIG